MIGFLGIAIGQDSVRDPGQKREDGLALIYFGGALVMLVNGFLSHKQTVQHYNEQGGSSSQEGA